MSENALMKSSTVWRLLAISFALSASPTVWADRIVLTNGQSLEGLITRQTHTDLVLQVALEGHMVLDRASIAKIEPASETQREALLAAWRQERKELKEREAREREFETQQRARGLVLHRGQWITSEELQAIRVGALAAEEERQQRAIVEARLKEEEETRKKEADARQQLEEELARITQQLYELQAQHVRLHRELSWFRHFFANRHHPRHPDHRISSGAPDQVAPMVGHD